jgi:DNA-binding CsgD family transcriptional regulator
MSRMIHAFFWILIAGGASATFVMAEDIYRDINALKPVGHIIGDCLILLMILLASVFAGLYFRLVANAKQGQPAATASAQTMEQQWAAWQLTRAESEVAAYIVRGLNFYQIADLLEKSERTVRQQAMSIYAKAGVRNRAELTGYLIENLADLPE